MDMFATMRSAGCNLISMNLVAKPALQLGWEPLGDVTQSLFFQAILSWICNGKCRLMHGDTGSYLHMTRVCDNAIVPVVLVTLVYVCRLYLIVLTMYLCLLCARCASRG